MAVDRFPIEAGHIMMFARAVGDTNQIYYDEGYAETTEPGGIIAPPTFVQASSQFDPSAGLRPTIGEPWFGSGREATGVQRIDNISCWCGYNRCEVGYLFLVPYSLFKNRIRSCECEVGYLFPIPYSDSNK